jgi:hypothetical protein
VLKAGNAVTPSKSTYASVALLALILITEK